MNRQRYSFGWLLVLLAAACLATDARAALVGTGGYTNGFGTQPPAADWSTLSIGSGAGNIISAGAMDLAVAAVAASSITTQAGADAADPPAFLGTAVWSSSGLYLQTRATGNDATLLMLTLVNNLGGAAISVRVSYDLNRLLPVTEEVDGHRAYYSLTGAAGSWVVIPEFSTATPARLTANLNIAWPAGANLYVLWADDNGSGTPDTAFQIDSISVTATAAAQSGVGLTSPPQSQTVPELAPVNFTVGTSGNPAPTYQWYKNDVAISGATNATHAIAAAPLSDSGALFKVIAANTASNVNYSVTSSPVMLSVTADTTAPTLASVFSVPFSTVSVTFSEPVRADTANVAASYTITGATGNLTVSSAVLSPGGSNVTLTTSPQSLGAIYTLLVSNVRDLSSASNQIAANSLAAFTVLSFTSADIGAPSPAGQTAATSGGLNLTAGGTNIAGTSDQFTFAYQQVSGNFDYKVRIAGLSLANAWSKAALMARESIAGNSIFAAAVATPSVSGAFFQSRATAGGTAASTGSGPVNYPNTWLRLTRSGSAFTGYVGLDGETWFQLGSSSIAMSASVYIGLAASASVTNGSAVPSTTAQFRDFQPVATATIATFTPDIEPPGPSSRRTPIAITEIMYNPAPNTNGSVLEFVEIYNSNPYFEDISGWRLSGDIDFTFPANTTLEGGEFRVIARNPAHLMAAYGISGVMGSYTNALKQSGTLRLRNKQDAILLDVKYDNQPPWPAAADGAGHSLVLARPSYGEGYVQAWGPSDRVGGSPGGFDGAGSAPQRNVVINEFFANSEAPAEDFVELYNRSNREVDISGCSLSDKPTTNKFIFTANTKIQSNSFLVVLQSQLGFGLSAAGETIYFRSADGTRVLDAVRFDAQGAGVSSGRIPDGAKEIFPLQARTPGTANVASRVHDIVINEIMYKPISGLDDDEYIEIYNKGVTTQNLGGWRFVAGIDYKFPTNTFLRPDSYLVIARNITNLLARYTNAPSLLTSNNTLGNYSGSLANQGERVALAMPAVHVTTNGMGQAQTNTIDVVVEEVTYEVGGQWGAWANEGGSSLELIDPRSNHRLAYNWADSDETAKAPWTTIQATGPMDNGAGTANLMEIMAFNEGEWLVDNVEVVPSIGGANALTQANSDFEGGQGGWNFRGTHIRSFIENSGGFGGGKCLHMRASARGDAVHNRCLVGITVPSGTITMRAKVRWLRGWPEILLRLHGNFMEAGGALLLPPNLGTPGARNSQAVSNAPPAIHAVSHAPVVPDAVQAVVVTARVHDPDGVSSVALKYRLDPGSAYTTVAMNDAGTGADSSAGDGIYSATIPGQSSGALVAYYLQATDGAGVPLTVSYPRGASPTTPECLVRFGDPVIASGFGTYRQWMTAYYYDIWNTRPALSNERLPMTLVNGNFRAFQFTAVKWAGSPYHQFAGAQPNATGHYSFDIPPDDLFLGTDNLNKLHAPGNGPFDDGNIQREQTCYWFARQLGLPWNYRRGVNVYFNGNRPGGTTKLMEDTETPGSDVVASRFAENPDGNLYKIQPWFEVDDGTTHSAALGFANNSWTTLNRYLTTSNAVSVHKTARYRHNFLSRAVKGSASEYNDVFALVDAADLADGPAYLSAIQGQCDMEQWMRTFAVHHSVGDWDHFGSRNSQNMYGYKAPGERWKLMIWDMNIVIGNGSSAEGANLFEVTGGGANMTKIFNNTLFRRMYLRALKELCNGAFQPANLNPVLDSKYSAYLASGVSPTSPANIKTWIGNARSSILGTVAGEDAAAFKINGANTISTATNLITITGEAPVEVYSIRLNGVEYPITWTSLKGWSIRIAVIAASNPISIQGYDIYGNAIANFSTNVTVNFTGTVVAPETALVINEIMYNPAAPEASFLELFNTSSNAFDLSGWRLNGLSYTFPSGALIAGRQYLVLARSASAFSLAYGTNAIPFGTYTGQFDPDGETLTLIKPATMSSPEVAIASVRYEARAPWAIAPAGSSLQLIDARQDIARVSNWSLSQGSEGPWLTFLTNINIGASTSSTNLYIFLDAAGTVDIDELSLIAQTGPTTGIDIIQNGGFESPLAGNWTGSGVMSGSAITTAVAFSGTAAMRLVCSGVGAAPATSASFWQSTSILPSTPYTLRCRYIPTSGVTNLTLRFNASARPVLVLTPPPAPPLSSPGAPNQVLDPNLPPYHQVWLNEVQPNNLTGPLDNATDRDPWLELYNSGPTNVDLSGYWLANNYTNLQQWQFPPGTVLTPGEFKVIWADGEPGETFGPHLHTSFRLGTAGGALALVRLVNGSPQITDYLNYPAVGPDLSYGDFPSGQPISRQVFYSVTPGGTNSAQPVAVFINEWMAANTTFITDPADNHYDDWFELYNPGSLPVDLTDYHLTDNLSNPTQFRIPAGYSIPAGGFLLVWADSEIAQNSTNDPNLHVSFKLEAAGEAIGLYAPNGFTPVDILTFTNQTNSISEGRFADGAATRYFMTTPTPGAPNTIGLVNTAPGLTAIGTRTLRLGQILAFTATAYDVDFPAQSLSFSLDSMPPGATISSGGDFAWTPSPAQAPSTNLVTVRVTDNGVPPLSATTNFTIIVRLPPVAAISNNGSGQVSVGFDTIPGRTYRVDWKLNLDDPFWTQLAPPALAAGATLVVNDNIGANPQRFYRITQVD